MKIQSLTRNLMFSAALAISSVAFAAIEELKSYRDLDLGNTQDTWVIFDIDNTLLRQDHMIGTHQWGDHVREEEIKKGRKPEQAAQIQYAFFDMLQPFVRTVPVEREVYPILTSLRAKGVPTFALTSRALGIAGTTLEQLAKNRMNFQPSFPALRPAAKDALAIHLFRGVLFGGGVPKGDLLKQVTQLAVRAPKRIIFVDDKKYNLDSLEASFKEGPIELRSLRYGGADVYLETFDARRAAREWDFFRQHGRLP